MLCRVTPYRGFKSHRHRHRKPPQIVEKSTDRGGFRMCERPCPSAPAPGPWGPGSPGPWALGPWAPGPWPLALGPLGPWALGPLGPWALGFLGSWVLGSLGPWVPRPWVPGSLGPTPKPRSPTPTPGTKFRAFLACATRNFALLARSTPRPRAHWALTNAQEIHERAGDFSALWGAGSRISCAFGDAGPARPAGPAGPAGPGPRPQAPGPQAQRARLSSAGHPRRRGAARSCGTRWCPIPRPWSSCRRSPRAP